MNLRQHSILAKRLITAVGGVKMAEHVGRVKSTQLYRAQDTSSPYCLPADVIVALETEAGEPLYTAAMIQAAPDMKGCADLMGGAITLGADASGLAVNIHQALADGRLSNLERDDLFTRLATIRAGLQSIEVELGRKEGLTVIDGPGMVS